jgi:hypothetical protein
MDADNGAVSGGFGIGGTGTVKRTTSATIEFQNEFPTFFWQRPPYRRDVYSIVSTHENVSWATLSERDRLTLLYFDERIGRTLSASIAKVGSRVMASVDTGKC